MSEDNLQIEDYPEIVIAGIIDPMGIVMTEQSAIPSIPRVNDSEVPVTPTRLSPEMERWLSIFLHDREK